MEWDSALRASALVIKIDGGEEIIPVLHIFRFILPCFLFSDRTGSI